MDISPLIKEKAPLILAEIQKAKSILLHCHPSPDPDSVGSALAMKFALEEMGKKATVIRGDSEIPQAFMHFPGAGEIVYKNYFELNLNEFDLFLSLDASAAARISTLKPMIFPTSLPVINIDHHPTNTNFGKINLVEASYPATAQILFDLFTEWKIKIVPEIAANLFIGIYTDTGGLKYRGASVRTFETAAKLIHLFPDFPDLISQMENSRTPGSISFLGVALNSVRTFLGGKLAMTCVSRKDLDDRGISDSDISTGMVSPMLRTVIGWDIDVAIVEGRDGEIKIGLRTRDADRYDVSKLAMALGGGGHKAAAGAEMRISLEEAKKLVVAKAKELYNL